MIDKLDKSGLTFEVVDIDDPKFSDARTYVTEVLGAKSTPVVVADDHEPIIGYQPEKLKALVSALTLNEGTV